MWLVIFGVSAVFAVGPDVAADIESRLGALESKLPHLRDDQRRMERLASEISGAFDEIDVLTPRVRGLSDDTLSAALRLAVHANFYAPGSQTTAHQGLFAELNRRGDVAALDVDDLHRALVADRRWNDAEDIRKQFPDVELQPLPSAISDASG